MERIVDEGVRRDEKRRSENIARSIRCAVQN